VLDVGIVLVCCRLWNASTICRPGPGCVVADALMVGWLLTQIDASFTLRSLLISSSSSVIPTHYEGLLEQENELDFDPC